MSEERDWSGTWRGRWIWDHEPVQAYWWRPTPAEGHVVYLRRVFDVERVAEPVPARVTCDSRYVLFVNGALLGRGPVRGEPEFLGWDTYDLGPHLLKGRNVVTALCRYYGSAGPWWVPAEPLGTLGRGSFCFETAPGSDIDLVSDTTWRAVPAPWVLGGPGGMHSFPAEVVDGRLAPQGVHDPGAPEDGWPNAVILSGRGHGTVLDRPPAAPYMTPLRRPIPQLTSVMIEPRPLEEGRRVRGVVLDDPVATWSGLAADAEGERSVSVWDLGRVCLGHVNLRMLEQDGASAGAAVDVVVGEDLRSDGLPETSPRNWAARYITGGRDDERVTFFDPVGFRYLAAHHPPDVTVAVEVEETTYPRDDGAAFDCDDPRYAQLWRTGLRTVDVCSTDAFLDCPGREQRAWVADSYPQILVSLVTNADRRLVRHHLELTARSRYPSGLLAGAAGCDFAHIGFTMPEYSLHWIRSLAAYWSASGDEHLVKRLLPVADGIVERYERQRGSSGLLEDFPGWVFIDWAQLDRDIVTGTHDALYAAALEAYATLPGASDVSGLRARTAAAFEALWDSQREVYVDAMGGGGLSRRVSQHTNASALLAGIVPEGRAANLIERITDPAASLGGRLVVTATSADMRDPDLAHELIPVFQYQSPASFDVERDVVAAQPWFCRFLHEALFRHGRRDLILESLLRWKVVPGNGTFEEFWAATPGTSSRCHGWSASPTYDLTAYILGVRPATPGYARALVDPYLGPLTRVSGRVPTPFGWLSASIEDAEIHVEVPQGMTVAVGHEEMESGQHRIPFRGGGR
ncbi:MAG: hypothetical protein H0V93_03245 [Euzebyales bacterium]|nr:hypothetical protein [Euzebyales bacterium]